MCVFNSPFDSCMHLNLFLAPIVYLIMLTLIRTYVYNKINEFAHEEFILLLNLFEITQNNVWVGNYLYSILSCSSVAIIQLSMKVFLDFPLGTFAGIELLIHISHTRNQSSQKPDSDNPYQLPHISSSFHVLHYGLNTT